MKKTLPPGLSKMKEELKVMAGNIRKKNKKLREAQRRVNRTKNHEKKDEYLEKCQSCSIKYAKLRNTYRHMHIAYSELCGKERKQIEIESKTRKPKNLSEDLIAKFKAEYL
ncbi:TPA: hypothetical protein DCZ39_04765 [Patescibacteria group bacterium]|nr:hypothetical protein [Candidatus Gracilibacteria bacterium]